MPTSRKKIDYWLDVEDSRKKIDNWLTDWLEEQEDRQLTDWLTRERKSTIDWLTDSKEKIDYWRIDRVLISHHDWLIDIQNRKINYWLSFSQTHDHSRWLTMRQVKVKYIHRLQRGDFFILADSRSFSQTHDAHSGSEVHSSSSKKRLRRLSQQKSFWSFVSFEELRSDDLILLTRVFRRAICFAESLIECQLVSQNSEREILLCWRREDDLVIVTAVDRKISCWRCAIVTKLTTILFLSTRWSSR